MTQTGALTGRTVVITGATSGLGKETARQLCAQGADVVIVARDEVKAAEVAGELGSGAPGTTPMGSVSTALADLSDLADVRALAADLQQRFERIDVLINNAGIDIGEQRQSKDGFELTFAVNYLAPFVLGTSLAPVMAGAATDGEPARVVNISSSGHRGGHIDLDDLPGRSQKFSGQRVYNNSKLALTLFTSELARRNDPTTLVANCADPGFVKGTTLGRELPFGYQVIGAVLTPFMATVDKGAKSAVWAASARQAGTFTGRYIKGGKQIEPSKQAQDRDLAARLWDATEELLSGSR
jgi:NAD(P)-dependent dehydrogenase (short-subunit alcohol dehydrogenase family)